MRGAWVAGGGVAALASPPPPSDPPPTWDPQPLTATLPLTLTHLATRAPTLTVGGLRGRWHRRGGPPPQAVRLMEPHSW